MNTQLRLKQRPTGRASASDFDRTAEARSSPGPGEVLVKVLYLSIDPTNRVWMSDVPQYMPPVAIGDVMRGAGLGEVLESNAPGFASGDLVFGLVGWQEYALMRPGGPFPLTRLPRQTSLPPQAFLGVCGPSGVTAYYGIVDICAPKPGETVVVTGAAGSVGSVAGQLAKFQGARAVGIAGGPEKCRLLVEEFGFDAAVDYKSPEWRQQLKAAVPRGVDALFENVGGPIMHAVFGRMNVGGRVALCGLINAYNGDGTTQGDFGALLGRRLHVHGFNIIDYEKQWPAAMEKLVRWVLEGRLRSRDTVVHGLERAPEALNMLFDGRNVGKLVVRVAGEAQGEG
ncbi:MAG TPA: NADP-dependent oxidoreductase [Steroidobacteraceae bacterium]|nr:NADP-dependent oxidoreductase [Steroidobacteraceae bacterium]